MPSLTLAFLVLITTPTATITATATTTATAMTATTTTTVTTATTTLKILWLLEVLVLKTRLLLEVLASSLLSVILILSSASRLTILAIDLDLRKDLAKHCLKVLHVVWSKQGVTESSNFVGLEGIFLLLQLQHALLLHFVELNVELLAR